MSVFENFTDVTINFSDTFGTPVLNQDGIRLGFLNDFFVNYEEVYPQVLALQYKTNKQFFYVSWKHVVDFTYQKIIISNEAFIGHSRTFPKASTKKIVTSLLASQFSDDTVEYPPVGKIILDKQIVDTHGKKVVRVNDIQFLRTGNFLRVTHTSIGFRSIVRRLGFEKLVDSLVKTIRPKSQYLSNETQISWKYVYALPNKNVHTSVKINLKNEEIGNLHPADLADILEDLDSYGRESIFNELSPKQRAETLSEIEDDVKTSLLKDEDAEDIAEIIENMDTDDAADILNEMSEEEQDAIMANIEDEETKEEIQELLEFEDHTAGGLMSSEVFEIGPELRRSEILNLIIEKEEELETIYDLYIINQDQKLLGSCTLRNLLIQTEDLEIKEIMNTSDIQSIHPDLSWKEVASYMSKYNLINVPVVNDDNDLLGVVSVDDILPWILNEKK